MISYKIPKVRWEVFLIHQLVFLIAFLLDFFLSKNFFILVPYEFLFVTLFYISLSFLWSLLVEFMYIVLKFFSTVLLRLGDLWKYSIPSILVFLLVIYPLFNLTELKNINLDLAGIKGNIYIVSIGLTILISILLILFFPMFYGLNGGFAIISCIISYSFISYIQYTFKIVFTLFEFLFLYYAFVFLFFLFLQTRRRFSLNILYENFIYPFMFITLVFLILLVSIYYRVKFSKHFFHFLLITFIIYLILFDLILILLLNFESTLNRRLFKISFSKILIIFIFNVSLILYLYTNFNSNYLIHLKKTNSNLVYFILTKFHFLFDKDKDGENNLFANDIEDLNIFSRSEGKWIKNEEIRLPEMNQNQFSNYIFITIYLRDFPNESKEYFVASSVDIRKTLFSLLYNTSSYETYLLLNGGKNLDKSKSILSFLTENFFRTICLGYLNNNSYFYANSEYKLDKGCEILETIETIKLPLLKENITYFFEKSKYYIQNYKTNKNFIWLHWDIQDYKRNIEKSELIDLLMTTSFKENLRIPYKKIVFLFFDNRIPYYEVYSDIEDNKLVLNNRFSYYGTLYRLLVYNELKFSSLDFFKEDFFLNEYHYMVTKNINHYIFLEINDLYWKELSDLFGNSILPPLSYDTKEKIFYDGRWGYKSNNFDLFE
ncbi:MAG: hypothetical protein ACK4UJ_11585 [Leptonema sp. (in: bacteria)]